MVLQLEAVEAWTPRLPVSLRVSDAMTPLSYLRGFEHQFSLFLRPPVSEDMWCSLKVALTNSITFRNNRRGHCLLTVALVRLSKKEIYLHSHTLFSSKWQRCNCTWMRHQGYSVVWCLLFKICRKVNKLGASIHAARTRKMLLSVIIAADVDGNRRGDGGVP